MTKIYFSQKFYTVSVYKLVFFFLMFYTEINLIKQIYIHIETAIVQKTHPRALTHMMVLLGLRKFMLTSK